MSTRKHPASSIVTVHVPLRFAVRGGRKTIIGDVPHETPKTRFDDSIAKALARAYRWKQRLEDGTYATVGELAKAERIDKSYVTRILRMNLLAPDIVEAALNGRTTFTVQSLTASLPAQWDQQRASLAPILSDSSTRAAYEGDGTRPIAGGRLGDRNRHRRIGKTPGQTRVPARAQKIWM